MTGAHLRIRDCRFTDVKLYNRVLTNREHYRFFAIRMFCYYFRHAPAALRRNILVNGFTEFNHNALSNVFYRYGYANVTFLYTPAERRLEDCVGGYEFHLPADSWQLCEIGMNLHNCVARYVYDVEYKQCTIVYATKDGSYRLCIEVRGNKVAQERADRNGTPNLEERAAPVEWHARRNLIEQ